MIPLGITETLAHQNRASILKKIKIIKTIFICICILPVLGFLLFSFKFIPAKKTIIAGVEEAVAKVSSQTSMGTAFLVSPTILLTARHVVGDIPIGGEISVIFEKASPPKQFNAKVIYYTPSNISPAKMMVPLDYFLSDIAVLQIPEVTTIKPVICGNSDQVAELDEVILIGFPTGDYSITDGKINSKSFENLDFFKSDVTSNPGNSGGPCILKRDNSVIGIVVGSRGPGYQGENIIIKMNNVKSFLRAKGISVSL